MTPARTTASSSPLEENQAPLAVLLLGPTGSGKTALSLALGERFGGEIVSCDSVAVYRGMELGTAKPTIEERARLPHHLIDVADPDQPFTAGEYSRLARAALSEIASRDRLPIVTGGTGLYLRALTEGLFAAPERQPALRARLERSRARHEQQLNSPRQITPPMNPTNSRTRDQREAVANLLNNLPNLPHSPNNLGCSRSGTPADRSSSVGWRSGFSDLGNDEPQPLVQEETWLHRLLTRLDPVSAARIHANDVPKLIRAIEVCMTAHKPLSEVIARDPLTGFRLLRIGLNPPRQALYDRLNRRCAAMFAAGLVEETRGLLDRYGPVKALDSLGYRQALRVLRESCPIEEAVAAAQQGHRNYAKRQLTWFRREPEVHWIAGFGDEPEALRVAAELVQNNP